jgi:hypothetical protein
VEPDALPPTGPEPVAVEPVGDRDARDVTNEASDPAASLASDAEPDDRARVVTNEAKAAQALSVRQNVRSVLFQQDGQCQSDRGMTRESVDESRPREIGITLPGLASGSGRE